MNGRRCTTCAADAEAGAGTGADMPFLKGAAAPGRHKLPQEFQRTPTALSVLGTLSVLLSCGMANTRCCASAICEGCVRVFLAFWCCLAGRKDPRYFSRKCPSHIINAMVNLFKFVHFLPPGVITASGTMYRGV